jgi:hypothetical protein
MPGYVRLLVVYLTVQGRRMVLGKKLVQASRDARYWIGLSLGVSACALNRLGILLSPHGDGVWFFRNLNRLVSLQARLGIDSVAS